MRPTVGHGSFLANIVTGLAFLLGLMCVINATASSVRISPAGTLDSSFGDGGKALTDFGLSESALAVALQSDGKVVVGGVTQDPSSFETRFAVARYNGNGTLDTSFDGDGRTTTSFGGGEARALGIAVQKDGKIVVAGGARSSDNSLSDFALARYNADGSLDSSFGSGGQVLTDFGARSDLGLGLVVQPDGKIVVAGGSSLCCPTKGDFALARYNADGSLDSSFGSGGKSLTDFGHSERAYDLAPAPGGKIVVVGASDLDNPTDFAVLRYNGDGTLDTSFDGDGEAVTDFGSGDLPQAVAVQRDGKVVAAGSGGSGAPGGYGFALARYNADGSLDTGFDRDGKVITTFGGHGGGANSVAVQAGGEIVAAGGSASGKNLDFALARYQPDGKLDGTFGAAGTVTTDLRSNSYDEGLSLAIQRDGRIVVAGISALSETSPGDFAVARYVVTRCSVPNVKRKPLRVAKAAITRENCTVGKVSRAFSNRVTNGRVISQKPTGGLRLRAGTRVSLVVSRGKKHR
jgi:uncharacterized delta-60 repeat protein